MIVADRSPRRHNVLGRIGEPTPVEHCAAASSANTPMMTRVQSDLLSISVTLAPP
jgi:hypothetical protein